jgi:uncharacterized membrane protein YgcG
MRIEVGNALSGSLSDALAKRILDDEVTPHFRNGDYDGGLTAGVDAIEKAILEGHNDNAMTPGQKRVAITNNLRQLVNSAREYMLDKSVIQVSYKDIVGPGKIIPSISTIADENYTSLIFTQTDVLVTVKSAQLGDITYRY